MTSPPPTITVLYVEDDQRLGDLTTQYLKTRGVDVHLFRRGLDALDALDALAPDVILLDLLLPDSFGQDLCTRIRARSQTPIIITSAVDEESDRVACLEQGADDYVTKPFSPRELLARIRAQARRSLSTTARARSSSAAGLELDPSTMKSTLNGAPLELTSSEFALLYVFVQRPGRVLSRRQLIDLTKENGDEVFERAIDVQISRIRQKIEDDPRRPKRLKTIRNVGYQLCDS